MESGLKNYNIREILKSPKKKASQYISCNASPVQLVLESSYRKPPNTRPGLIFVRKHFLMGLNIGELIHGGFKIYRETFGVIVAAIIFIVPVNYIVHMNEN